MTAQFTTATTGEPLTVPAAVRAAGHPTHTTAVLAVPERPGGGAGIAAGGTSLIVVLLIGFYLYRSVEKKKAKWAHITLAFTAGVLLSGSMVGVMAQQTAGSVGGGLVTMFSTITSGGK